MDRIEIVAEREILIHGLNAEPARVLPALDLDRLALKKKFPSSGGCVPEIALINVDLPAPLSPTMATISAAWTSRDQLGCIVALKVLEICGRPEVRSMVHYIAERFRQGLRAIQEQYPDWLVGIRQDGVVIGLEFEHPEGAKLVMRHLYENGVWAIFSTLDPRVLQFKPGILLGPDLVDEVLDRTSVGIGLARAEARGKPQRQLAVSA